MSAPPERILDDPAAYALDRSGMFGHIEHVGDELERAWLASARVELGEDYSAVRTIVVAGIGGSATAGDYFAAIAFSTSPIPVLVVQGYVLPAWIGPSTLVVVCSYSGNTAESLAAFEEAISRGARIVAITGGGRLAQEAREHRFPLFPIDYIAAPRATTVHSLGPLLRIGSRLGVTSVHDPEIWAAGRAHRELTSGQISLGMPLNSNLAKQFAASLAGKAPFVLGAGHLAPAAVRFKNQLAENAKMLAAADFIPEAGHNLVVGLATAARTPDAYAALGLRAASLPPPSRTRFDAVLGQFAEAGIATHSIEIDGGSALADLLVATAWGDFVSCYLAILNGEDPTPIPQIERVRAYGG